MRSVQVSLCVVLSHVPAGPEAKSCKKWDIKFVRSQKRLVTMLMRIWFQFFNGIFCVYGQLQEGEIYQESGDIFDFLHFYDVLSRPYIGKDALSLITSLTESVTPVILPLDITVILLLLCKLFSLDENSLHSHQEPGYAW